MHKTAFGKLRSAVRTAVIVYNCIKEMFVTMPKNMYQCLFDTLQLNTKSTHIFNLDNQSVQ